jgi:hypothetical protein
MHMRMHMSVQAHAHAHACCILTPKSCLLCVHLLLDTD